MASIMYDVATAIIQMCVLWVNLLMHTLDWWACAQIQLAMRIVVVVAHIASTVAVLMCVVARAVWWLLVHCVGLWIGLVDRVLMMMSACNCPCCRLQFVYDGNAMLMVINNMNCMIARVICVSACGCR